jgi:CheY-like chemotaxis protein
MYLAISGISLNLMDIQMPIKDGIQATKEIREHEEKFDKKQVAIFGITANATEEAKAIGLQAGMTVYYVKPLPHKVLVEAIDAPSIPEFLPDNELVRHHTF